MEITLEQLIKLVNFTSGRRIYVLRKVREVADEIGFSGPKDTGRFMKEFMGRFKGKVEGRDVQAAIKQLG